MAHGCEEEDGKLQDSTDEAPAALGLGAPEHYSSRVCLIAALHAMSARMEEGAQWRAAQPALRPPRPPPEPPDWPLDPVPYRPRVRTPQTSEEEYEASGETDRGRKSHLGKHPISAVSKGKDEREKIQ